MSGRGKVLLGAVGVALAGVGAATVLSRRGAADGGAARTVAVERGEIVARALAVGTIEPRFEVSVKSKVSGVVKREFHDVGDFVRAGTPLLEIQPTPTPLELVEARRRVELREIEVEELAKELDRKRALRESDLISEFEFDAAERAYREAELNLQLARERLALLREGRVTIARDRIETVIKSPIAGFILERMVEVGDPVVPLTSYQEGTVLMTMAEMDDLVFRGTVDEIDVGRLREGMPAVIRIGALPGVRVEGVLARISLKGRTEDNATVFPVEIELTETGGAVLRAGYSANAEIVVERRTGVLLVPERLVRFEDGEAWVTVRRPDGTTERRRVETGLSDALNVEIVSGLEEGEPVVEPPPREIR